MQICHLTSVHSQTDTRIFIKECTSLEKAGFNVNYIVPGAENATINGIRIHGVEKRKANRLMRMTKTVKDVYRKALQMDVDVYHIHDPELIPIGLKLKRKGKKVVYDVHEDVPRQMLNKSWLPTNMRKILANLFEVYENKASIKFDLVVAATPLIRDRFSRLGANVIGVNNFPLLDEMKLDANSWDNKEKAICYVGGITKYRGIEEMVESLKLTEGLHLLLAGKFTNSGIREIVTRMDGWNKVRELGFLNRAEVKKVYEKSIAGLVLLHPRTNYIDSLPVKMFEYMAAGIPVVASHFPLWKSIIEENNCGFCVNPLNPQEIANAINFLNENPTAAQQMGENGRKAIETKYNWEQESEKLIEAYMNLIK